MKKLTLLFLVISFKLFGQDSTTVRTLGAIPTDIATLSKMTLAVPQAGAIGALPTSFRMDDECPPVTNQCFIGSCVSEATAYGLCGILARRQYGWNYYNSYNQPDMTHLFSSMYMHFFIKGCGNDCGRCGSQLGYAANFLMNYGVINKSMWNPNQCDRNSCNYQPNLQPNPNNPSAFRLSSVKPLFIPGVQYTQGYKANAIRYYISQRYPVPIAMYLDQGFDNGISFNNPKDTWQTFYGQSAGGHAMLIVGYDDNRGAFLVMNSWGTTNWNLRKNDPTNDAKPGYCWISYNIIENYCFDAFVANEPQTGYAIPVSDLLTTNNSVKTTPEENKSKIADVEFFITNRYNQYDSVRFIPMNIDKKKQEATVAVYKIRNEEPIFFTAFNTKPNQTDTLSINGRTFTFKSLYIKPWRKYLGIFKGSDALFYQINID